MYSALLKLRNAQSSMSSTEANITEYILSNPETASRLTIRELARNTYASPSSIVRVCRLIGFSGYREFRHALSLELEVLGKDIAHQEENINIGDSMSTIIEKVTFNNMRSLNDTQRLLDPDTFSACVDLLINCDTILLFGLGSSLAAAKDTYLKFLRLNKPCVVNEDWHSQLLMARNSTPRDVGIAFSYGGQTMEVIECMKALKENFTVTSEAYTSTVKAALDGLQLAYYHNKVAQDLSSYEVTLLTDNSIKPLEFDQDGNPVEGLALVLGDDIVPVGYASGQIGYGYDNALLGYYKVGVTSVSTTKDVYSKAEVSKGAITWNSQYEVTGLASGESATVTITLVDASGIEYPLTLRVKK